MFRKYLLTVRSKVFLCFFLFLSFNSLAQSHYYFITFTDKAGNEFSIEHPEKFLSSKAIERRTAQGIQLQEEDLPVTSDYLDFVRAVAVSVKGISKWFNGVLAELAETDAEELKKKQFIKTVKYLQPVTPEPDILKFDGATIGSTSIQSGAVRDYGPSVVQAGMLKVPEVHDLGYTGAGKLIAVLDNGFFNASALSFFSHLYQNGKIVGTYDFVESEENVYDEGAHGVSVLSVLAGYEEGKIIGPAYEASFLLLRTEDDFLESVLEEYYWLMAAEYADSAGADIISSSLGYHTFDFPEQNYTYADMDGKTTIITNAAETAFAKGMIVVNSAGNDGDNTWRYITAPADGPSVLTVGALNSDGAYVSFSSVGPTADGRVKPDLTAMGARVYVGNYDNSFSQTNGTSFACPMVAGLVACLWQARPELTNRELVEALKKTASKVSNPDHQYGFGIPDFRKVLTYSSADTLIAGLYPNPVAIPGEVKMVFDRDLLLYPVQAELFDLTGKKIVSQTISAAEKVASISLSGDIQKGIYILVLRGPHARQVIKLILQ
jgi:serine protease AprX